MGLILIAIVVFVGLLAYVSINRDDTTESSLASHDTYLHSTTNGQTLQHVVALQRNSSSIGYR